LHVAPPVTVQVHVAPTISGGNRSVIWALSAVDGPAFDTVMVYVVDVPGRTLVTPSVLVTDRSTNGVRSSVSVDVLSEVSTSATPAGGAVVAVLTSVPVAAASIVAVRV
jgi:hypothetical protein